MNGFVFRLQKVLELRQRQEEAAAAAFEAAAARCHAMAAEVAAWRQQLEQRLDRSSLAAATLDVAQLEREAAYLEKLKRELARAEERWREAERLAGERHAQLLAAAQARRLLERLREQQAEAFARERARAAQLHDDEVALRSYGNGRASADAGWDP